LGNVAGVSIPSEKQLIQERLVKGRKDKKKKKKKKEEEDDDEGGEELGGAEAVGPVDDDNDDGWGDVEEGKPSRRAASPSSSNDGGGVLSGKIFPISQLCQIMDSPGILRRARGHVPPAHGGDVRDGPQRRRGGQVLERGGPARPEEGATGAVPPQAVDRRRVEGRPGHRGRCAREAGPDTGSGG